MKRQKRALAYLLITLVVTAVVITVSVYNRRNSTVTAQSGVGDDQPPIADYSTSESSDQQKRAKRQARSGFYDEQGLVIEPKAPGGDIVVRSEKLRKMPALPSGISDAVVIGEVAGAEAYLSNDKSGVYTEFDVRVDELVRDNTGSITPSIWLTAQRTGGRVRFPSGRIQKYGIYQQGMPRKGRRYVL